MLDNVLVGCGQITWRNRENDAQILSEIAQAGYDGAPFHVRRGETTAERMALYANHGLKPAPGYLSANYWEADRQAAIIERAQAMAQAHRQAGCTEIYIAPGGFDYVGGRGLDRRQVAGHVEPADGLPEDAYRQFAETLNRVGEITLREGVRACFHNHVGSVIETRAEIDHLFSLVDRSLVFMGPDTGHLAWGGVDVAEFCRDYATDIKTVHLKDIDPQVLAEGRANDWDYGTFADNGIFAELGAGFIDFPAIFEVLREAGFQGWLITETDVPQKATALESAIVSRDYLKQLGI